MSALTSTGTHQDSACEVENQLRINWNTSYHSNWFQGENTMKIFKMIVTVVAGTVLAAGAFAQSAKEVRGASPYVAVENEYC